MATEMLDTKIMVKISGGNLVAIEAKVPFVTSCLNIGTNSDHFFASNIVHNTGAENHTKLLN